MRDVNITPDGMRYLAVSIGQRVARPFHWRWLVPTACGTSATKWRAVRAASLVGLLPAAWWYGGFGWRGLFVAALALGCAGVWRFNWRHPILVDAPALTLAVTSAAAAQHGLWPVAILCALLAGATKETAPVFAALFAWSPIPLVGLVAPLLRTLQRSGDDVLDQENAWILRHPVAASRKYHAGTLRWTWVLPWGACLVGLGHLSWPLAAALAAAYAQCAVATDTVRLYQWAYPALALAAAHAVDARWYLPLLALHLVNPFATEGG